MSDIKKGHLPICGILVPREYYILMDIISSLYCTFFVVARVFRGGTTKNECFWDYAQLWGEEAWWLARRWAHIAKLRRGRADVPNVCENLLWISLSAELACGKRILQALSVKKAHYEQSTATKASLMWFLDLHIMVHIFSASVGHLW